MSDRKYEYPRVSMHCKRCGNDWDAWVLDNGSLVEPRDKYCCGIEADVRRAEPLAPDSLVPNVELYTWRKEQLEQLGFLPEFADLIAGGKFDLETVRAAMRGGCPHVLAIQLFS